MERHVFTITEPAKQTPKINLPDGLITGNGDVTVTLAGGPDRVRVYIGKADFWKADEPIYRNYSERFRRRNSADSAPSGWRNCSFLTWPGRTTGRSRTWTGPRFCST